MKYIENNAYDQEVFDLSGLLRDLKTKLLVDPDLIELLIDISKEYEITEDDILYYENKYQKEILQNIKEM